MMSYTKKSFALVSLLLISCYSQSNDRTENNPNTQANISSVSQTHDLDLQLRGNLEFAKKHQIQYHYKPFNIQNEQYMVGVYSKQPINNNVRYLILHDNENASFDSGLHTIANGGLMIVLENNEQRYLFDQNSQETTTVDHNRIFKPSGKYYALAKYILEHLDLKPNTLLVALHNNSLTSGFGIKNIKKYGNTHIECQHDSEQTPNIAKGDGSLSIFAANHHYRYVNIEVKAAQSNQSASEHYAREKQISYIKNLLEFAK